MKKGPGLGQFMAVLTTMQSSWMVLLFSVPIYGAFAATAADDAFELLAEQFVADLPEFSPVASTWIGDHSRDDELDQVDTGARARLTEALASYQQQLDAKCAAIDR